MIVDKELVKLEILDLAGYHSEKGEGYDDAVRAAHGVVFVFAIDYHDSFKDLLKLKDRILQLKPDTPFGMIVCGHKSDIIRDKRIGTFVDVSEIKVSFLHPFALWSFSKNSMLTTSCDPS